MALSDANRRITIHDIAEKMNVWHSINHDYLKRLGLILNLNICFAHSLKNMLAVTFVIWLSNLNKQFFKRIIIGDENWVLHNNVKCKRSCSKKYEPDQTIRKLVFRKKNGDVWLDFQMNSFFFLYRPTQRSIWSVSD